MGNLGKCGTTVVIFSIFARKYYSGVADCHRLVLLSYRDAGRRARGKEKQLCVGRSAGQIGGYWLRFASPVTASRISALLYPHSIQMRTTYSPRVQNHTLASPRSWLNFIKSSKSSVLVRYALVLNPHGLKHGTPGLQLSRSDLPTLLHLIHEWVFVLYLLLRS